MPIIHMASTRSEILVSEGESVPCDRLPIKLDVCPVCSHGFKQSRGWTWVDLCGLVGGEHAVTLQTGIEQVPNNPHQGSWSDWPEESFELSPCRCNQLDNHSFCPVHGLDSSLDKYQQQHPELFHEEPIYGPAHPCACFSGCPLCKHPKAVGKAGLLWIGEKFYKTPDEFMCEGREMGFSRRVHAIPRNFKVGETWVMLAHPKGIDCVDCDIENPSCLTCHSTGKLPAIFTLWRPTRIEKIYVESQRDSEEVKKAVEQGITPVFVPDDDKDHQGF